MQTKVTSIQRVSLGIDWGLSPFRWAEAVASAVRDGSVKPRDADVRVRYRRSVSLHIDEPWRRLVLSDAQRLRTGRQHILLLYRKTQNKFIKVHCGLRMLLYVFPPPLMRHSYHDRDGYNGKMCSLRLKCSRENAARVCSLKQGTLKYLSQLRADVTGLVLLVPRLELFPFVVKVTRSCQGRLGLVLEERVVQHLRSQAWTPAPTTGARLS